ncbi:hypothetical protein COLO4_06616 [Corchorus olitorius]|uniref:Uncharacterized protein n=1 Tax=Corchorus olitorius TaxID=93759 RepID=A0A1R3KMI4_9ROSI|nr:hypothetical protein COLO4_06616 [Corchorus olitorius]
MVALVGFKPCEGPVLDTASLLAKLDQDQLEQVQGPWDP